RLTLSLHDALPIFVGEAHDHGRAHQPAGRGDDQKREDEDPLHGRTSSAPAARRISRTEPPRPGATWMATPKRSLVKRGSKLGLGVSRGSRPSSAMPSTVAIPPNRIVSSNAMTTKGGMEATGLPPVVRPHCSEDQTVSMKPDAMPVGPAMTVKRRTRLTGRSRSSTSSIDRKSVV